MDVARTRPPTLAPWRRWRGRGCHRASTSLPQPASPCPVPLARASAKARARATATTAPVSTGPMVTAPGVSARSRARPSPSSAPRLKAPGHPADHAQRRQDVVGETAHRLPATHRQATRAVAVAGGDDRGPVWRPGVGTRCGGRWTSRVPRVSSTSSPRTVAQFPAATTTSPPSPIRTGSAPTPWIWPPRCKRPRSQVPRSAGSSTRAPTAARACPSSNSRFWPRSPSSPGSAARQVATGHGIRRNETAGASAGDNAHQGGRARHRRR